MIPNTTHFIFGMTDNFGGYPYNALHYAAVKSAQRLNHSTVVMHVGSLPAGEWWDRTLALGVTINRVTPPTEIYGKPLRHHAHRADVLRLQTLLQHGGMYLDLDVITVKDFEPLRHRHCVWGRERGGTLCNGVILAEPGAEFLNHCLEAFQNFRSTGRDQFYAELACRVPARLAAEYPDLLTVEPECSFHTPDYRVSHGIKELFGEGDIDYGGKAYAHHLWASVSGCYHNQVDLVRLAEEGKSYFARLLRPWLL